MEHSSLLKLLAKWQTTYLELSLEEKTDVGRSYFDGMVDATGAAIRAICQLDRRDVTKREE